jgi:hypothetical protein
LATTSARFLSCDGIKGDIAMEAWAAQAALPPGYGSSGTPGASLQGVIVLWCDSVVFDNRTVERSVGLAVVEIPVTAPADAQAEGIENVYAAEVVSSSAVVAERLASVGFPVMLGSVQLSSDTVQASAEVAAPGLRYVLTAHGNTDPEGLPSSKVVRWHHAQGPVHRWANVTSEGPFSDLVMAGQLEAQGGVLGAGHVISARLPFIGHTLTRNERSFEFHDPTPNLMKR